MNAVDIKENAALRRFHKLQQRPGASAQEYVKELESMLQQCCNREDIAEALAKDRLVVGLRDQGLRQRLSKMMEQPGGVSYEWLRFQAICLSGGDPGCAEPPIRSRHSCNDENRPPQQSQHQHQDQGRGSCGRPGGWQPEPQQQHQHPQRFAPPPVQNGATRWPDEHNRYVCFGEPRFAQPRNEKTWFDGIDQGSGAAPYNGHGERRQLTWEEEHLFPRQDGGLLPRPQGRPGQFEQQYQQSQRPNNAQQRMGSQRNQIKWFCPRRGSVWTECLDCMIGAPIDRQFCPGCNMPFISGAA